MASERTIQLRGWAEWGESDHMDPLDKLFGVSSEWTGKPLLGDAAYLLFKLNDFRFTEELQQERVFCNFIQPPPMSPSFIMMGH